MPMGGNNIVSGFRKRRHRVADVRVSILRSILGRVIEIGQNRFDVIGLLILATIPSNFRNTIYVMLGRRYVGALRFAVRDSTV